MLVSSAGLMADQLVQPYTSLENSRLRELAAVSYLPSTGSFVLADANERTEPALGPRSASWLAGPDGILQCPALPSTVLLAAILS